MHELAIPSDPSKPPPEDVLKTLSFGLPEFMNRLIELHCVAESSLCLTPLDKEARSVQLITTSTNERNLVGLGHVSTGVDLEPKKCLKERRLSLSLSSQEEDGANIEGDANVKLSSNDELPPSQMIETSDKKVIHHLFLSFY